MNSPKVNHNSSKNIQFLNYQGKEIICITFANLSVIRNKEEIIHTLNDAKILIKNYPPKSLLLITDISGTGFNKEISDAFKDYASHNTPYIKASAIVGLSGMQKIVFNLVKKITGRNFFLTGSLEAAKEWLVNQ